MKYTLNSVSWNSLKEIFHSVSLPLENGLGIVSPPDFVDDFSRKVFFMLYFINWPNFIAWLLLLLKILGNMCIAIVC